MANFFSNALSSIKNTLTDPTTIAGRAINATTGFFRGAPTNALQARIGEGLTESQTIKAEQVTGIKPPQTGQPYLQQGIPLSQQSFFNQPLTRNAPTVGPTQVEINKQAAQQDINKFIQTGAAGQTGQIIQPIQAVPQPTRFAIQPNRDGGIQPINLSSFGDSGVSGISSGQFGGGTGISSFGGAGLLPGSLSSPFRSAGVSIFNMLPSDEELKKRKRAIVSRTENIPGAVRDFFIPTAQAGTVPPGAESLIQSTGLSNVNFPKTTPGQQQGQFSLGQDLRRVGGFLGGVNRFLGGAGQMVDNTRPPVSMLPNLDFGGQTTLGGLLSGTQNDIIGYIRGTKKTGATTGAPEMPSTRELSGAPRNASGDIVLDQTTESSFNQTAGDRVQANYEIRNKINQDVTEQIKNDVQTRVLQDIVSKSGGYIKSTDPTTGQINVAKVDQYGLISRVSPEIAQTAGPNGTPLNITNLPDASEHTNQINNALSRMIDTQTGLPYSQKDFDIASDVDKYDPSDETRKGIEKLQKELDDFKKTDPFASENLQSLNEKYTQETGLASDKTLRNSKQELLNLTLTEFSKIIDDVRNSNIPTSLAERRINSFTTKNKYIVDSLTREIENLDKTIKEKTDEVTKKLNLQISQYNIYKDRREDIQASINTLTTNLDKVSDNARALSQIFIQNPALLEGATETEIDSIMRGSIPRSMLKKISTLTGNDYDNIHWVSDTSGSHLLGRNKKTGAVEEIGSTTIGAETGGGGNVYRIQQKNPDGTESLLTYDISNPQNPRLVSTTPMPGASTLSVDEQFRMWANQMGGKLSRGEIEKQAKAQGVTFESTTESGRSNKNIRDSLPKKGDGTGTPFNQFISSRGQVSTQNKGITIMDPKNNEQFYYEDPNDTEVQQALKSGWVKVQ